MSKEEKFTVDVIKNSLVLPFDSLTSNYSDGIDYFEQEEKEHLFNINWNTNTLQVYDLQSADLIRKIPLLKTGPNAYGDIFGFWVKNLDSIYLFTQMRNEIVQINSKGDIKNRIKYTTPDLYSTAFQHNAYFRSDPFFIDDSVLMVKTHLQGNYRSMTDAVLENSALSYTINVNSGETNLIKVNYPENYLNNGLKLFEYSMAADDEKMVFSFFGDHFLYFTDRANPKSLQKRAAKSDFFPETMPLFPDGGREETYTYLFAGERYESLIYDKYRELYYRIAMHALDVENEDQLRGLRRTPGPFSVMIFNKDLQLLAERKMSDNRYLPSLFFVGKRGLYISANHPDNLEIKENEMVFDLVRIKYTISIK